jgi:hypothetical protein
MFGPTWRAPQQWVRLRLLNGCNARILVLRLSDATPLLQIANEAGLESRFIGRIALYDESSTVELPAGMPKEVANLLKRTRVKGVPINLRPDTGREGGWNRPVGKPGKVAGEAGAGFKPRRPRTP